MFSFPLLLFYLGLSEEGRILRKFLGLMDTVTWCLGCTYPELGTLACFLRVRIRIRVYS